MHVRNAAACFGLLLAQLASAQDLQPIPQGNAPFQPTPLPIEPIRVGEPTPAKRPAPAMSLDAPETDHASFADDTQSSGDVIQTATEIPVKTLASETELPPSALLQRALQTKNDADGPIRQLPLREAIDRAGSRSEQLEVVKAYWRLSAALADHNHASDELRFLAQVPQAQAQHDQAVLQSWLSAAEARTDEAKLALIAAQEDLATAARLSDAELPIPVDIPFTGTYRTRFESLFSGRTAPAEMRRIHRTLPHYLSLIQSRAAAVADADAALGETLDAYEAGNVVVHSVLDAFVHLRDQRIAFLATVRDYNHAIAEYALNVTVDGLSRDRVVSMLINHGPVAKSVLVPQSEVRPATAVQPKTLEPNWTERRGAPADAEIENPSAASPPSNELVPVKPKPGDFVPQLGAPPIEPLEDSGFRLSD